ncbi:MAG: hypothetical protein JWM14_1578 [Chitinophagaceae bacterium]|nr:hypothetical protein [Chitinophagaceae bacterium]
MPEHTDVENKNWFQRIKDAFMGVPMGIIYVAAACWAIVYGEMHHAKTTNLIKYTRNIVQETSSRTISPTLNDHLILISDTLQSKQELTDPLFGIKTTHLKLYREIKICQWEEEITKKTTNKSLGRTTDTIKYNYHKTWNTKLINSDRFKYKDKYKNPKKFGFVPAEYTANTITMGTYRLSAVIKKELKNYTPVAIANTTYSNAIVASDTFLCLSHEVATDAAIYYQAMLSGPYLYIGKGTPTNPQIGDHKIVFWSVAPNLYTIVGEQKDQTLQTKKLTDGLIVSELNCGTNFNYDYTDFAIIKSGKHNLSEMYAWAGDENDHLFVIGFRFWGFLFMVAGFRKITAPLVVTLSIIPFWRKFSAQAISRLSFLLATSITLLLAGTTWLIFNNFSNVSRWDYYFLILIVLTFIGAVRVKASMGEETVDSADFFK